MLIKKSSLGLARSITLESSLMESEMMSLSVNIFRLLCIGVKQRRISAKILTVQDQHIDVSVIFRTFKNTILRHYLRHTFSIVPKGMQNET